MYKINTITVPQIQLNKFKEEYYECFKKVDKEYIDNLAKTGSYEYHILTDGERYYCNGLKIKTMCKILNLPLPEVDCYNFNTMVFYIRETYKEEVNLNIEINGRDAYQRMFKILKRFYSKEKIHDIFNSFNCFDIATPYKESYVPREVNKIYEFENCYYFDLNSAYCSALSNIFPKAKNALNELFERRKEQPENKNLFNYFIGFTKKLGYDGFYYEIVRQTKEKLLKAIKESDGNVIYANTDGFIVNSPNKLLSTSKKLGDWKCEEFNKTCYLVKVGRDDNTSPYTLFQIGDYTTGLGHRQIAKQSKLSEGRVIKYKLTKENNLEIIKNIREELI